MTCRSGTVRNRTPPSPSGEARRATDGAQGLLFRLDAPILAAPDMSPSLRLRVPIVLALAVSAAGQTISASQGGTGQDPPKPVGPEPLPPPEPPEGPAPAHPTGGGGAQNGNFGNANAAGPQIVSTGGGGGRGGRGGRGGGGGGGGG